MRYIIIQRDFLKLFYSYSVSHYIQQLNPNKAHLPFSINQADLILSRPRFFLPLSRLGIFFAGL